MAEMVERRAPHQGVNSLTPEQIKGMVNLMLTKGQVIPIQRSERTFYKCVLVTTGVNKHAQVTIPKHFAGANGSRKELVHLIWWRWQNAYALIPEGLHISHLDQDQQVLHLTAETPFVNESRKACHLMKWYNIDPLRGFPRCPHWECPCTGP